MTDEYSLGKQPQNAPEESSPVVRSAGLKTSVSAFDYLRAGVPLRDMPPDRLKELAAALGNSAFLDLLSAVDGIETVKDTARGWRGMEMYGAVNEIKTEMPETAEAPVFERSAELPGAIGRNAVHDRATDGQVLL